MSKDSKSQRLFADDREGDDNGADREENDDIDLDELREMISEGSDSGDNDYEEDRDGDESFSDNGELEDDASAPEDPAKFAFSDDDDDDDDNYDPNEDDDLMDDEFEFRNILREASNMKPKRRKGDGYRGGRVRADKISPEVRIMLSEANEAFVRGDYQVALDSYMNVVRTDPKNFAAFKAIGEIYRSQGNISKCCNFWILAAHLHSWDSDFWVTVGDLSYELGHTRQALYCYTHSIQTSKRKNQTNLEAVFKRAILFRETGRYIKAAGSFLKLRHLDPTNETILKELVVVYVNENKISQAIDIYWKAFQENAKYRNELLYKNANGIDTANFHLTTVNFSWSELNILSELYAKQTKWNEAVEKVRLIARWIQGRESQVWWDDVNDDSEFDDRRFDNPKFKALPEHEKAASHELPIDIRVQLGLFRLHSGKNAEALRHFDFLKTDANEEIEEYADLFHEVGKALEEKMLYKEALAFLSSLTHVEEFYNIDLILSVSKCLFNAHLFQEAKMAYEACLKFEPDNTDVLTSLVEIGNVLQDQEYVDDILERIYDIENKMPEETEGNSPAEEDAEGDIDMTDNNNIALIEDIPRKRRLTKLTDQERYQKDQQLNVFVEESFKRLNRLVSAPQKGDKFSSDLWMSTTLNIVEIFAVSKGIFIGEKCEPFRKYLTDNRNSEPRLRKRLQRIERVREQVDLDRRNARLAEKETSLDFRGKSFDVWFDLLMEMSLMLASRGDQNAFAVLYACEEATCFEGETKDKIRALIGVSLSAQFNDNEQLSNYTRLCLNQHQFSSAAVELFILMHKGDNEIGEEYHSSQQKFFLRQIKAFDSLRTNTKITGMASVSTTEVDTSHEHPLLNYVYAGLLLSSKSYVSHLTYIQKLIDDGWKNEPMLHFCLGIGHIHRAMNRLANNRNLELLQGITCLLKYSEMKLSDPNSSELDIQETDYNLGRAFHMLGLASLAIEQYRKVLARKLGFLEAEANYNMYLISNVYGTAEGVELMTV